MTVLLFCRVGSQTRELRAQMGKGRRAEGKEGHFSFSSDDGQEPNLGYFTSAVRNPLLVTRSLIRLATTPHGKTVTVCPSVFRAGTEKDPSIAGRDLNRFEYW